MNSQKNIRNKAIMIFVVLWLFVFNYESLRAGYLNPLFGDQLPKLKFLFPPAGWIMFFRVDESESKVEVYGIKNERYEYIDPHRIFENRWLGYDNIRRNVLISVLPDFYSDSFCRYLKRKFPGYERFGVALVGYPSSVRYRGERVMRFAYEC